MQLYYYHSDFPVTFSLLGSASPAAAPALSLWVSVTELPPLIPFQYLSFLIGEANECHSGIKVRM